MAQLEDSQIVGILRQQPAQQANGTIRAAETSKFSSMLT